MLVETGVWSSTQLLHPVCALQRSVASALNAIISDNETLDPSTLDCHNWTLDPSTLDVSYGVVSACLNSGSNTWE